MADHSLVPKVYNSVVEDVINNVREAFLDESVDEQVLVELKQLWESKLRQTKAIGSLHNEDQLVSIYARNQQQQQQEQAERTQAALQAERARVQQQQQQQQASVQLPMYNPASGTLELSSAAQAATIALPAGIYQQQLQGLPSGTIIQGQGGMQYIIQAAPSTILQTQQSIASSQVPTTVPAQQVIAGAQPQQPQPPRVIQLDGNQDDSSSDDDDDDDDAGDDDDNDDDDHGDGDDEQGEEEEPLNSGDDVSEEDPTEVFDTDNVVVCQFDKINRSKNRWKFHLKDGIMNLNGRDYVFQKALGDAEW